MNDTSLRFLNTYTAGVLAAVEESALDLSPEWTIMVDTDSRVVLVNPAKGERFKLHVQLATGMTFHQSDLGWDRTWVSLTVAVQSLVLESDVR